MGSMALSSTWYLEGRVRGRERIFSATLVKCGYVHHRLRLNLPLRPGRWGYALHGDASGAVRKVANSFVPFVLHDRKSKAAWCVRRLSNMRVGSFLGHELKFLFFSSRARFFLFQPVG